MMSNLGRVLTITVKITDPEAAKWIWDAHLGEPQHGVKVTAISDGDLVEESFDDEDEDEDELPPGEYFIMEEGETPKEAMLAHVEGMYSLSDAIEAAPRNVSPGSQWFVVNRRGEVIAAGKKVEHGQEEA
jgi:hypothetical protein